MKLKVWGLKRSVFFNNIRIASSDVSYQRRTKEMKKITEAFAKLRVWQLAFLVNLLAAMLAVVPFLIRDHGYFAMSHDFTAQEIAFNIFMNDTIKSGNLLWNWGLDLGSNFLETFSFYNVGSVFLWFTLLFPAKVIPRVMGWMVILKFAVAGACAAAFLERHVKERWLVVMASLLYAFSGFQCSSVVFYHFQDPVALFPLMLLGLECLIEDNKKGRLALACVLNAFCNYIFFVGEVIFLVIYYIAKYLVPDIRERRRGVRNYLAPIGSCFLEGAIGFFSAGILMISSIHGTLANSRVNEHLPGEAWLGMSTSEWLRLLKGFLVPAEPMNQIASVVQADWMTNAAYLPLVGIVFALAYAMRKKDWLGRILKICAVIAVVPVLNNMFMFFGVETYRRWYYMFILLLALATAKVLEQPEEYPVPAATGIWAGALLLFYVLTNVVKWSGNEEHVVYRTEWYYRGILIAIAGVLIALFIVRFGKKYRTQALTAMTMLFSAGTLLLAIRGYQVTTDNSNLDFKTYPNSYAENVVNYMTEIPGELDRDVLPYRYYFDEGIGHTYYNLAMTASLPSINSFISTIHPSVMEFYDAVGIGRGTWTNAGGDGLQELLSARYIVSDIEQPDAAYISTFTNDNGQEMYYYENERALPIGFAYDTYMTKSQFEQIDPQLRALTMLTTLVVDDADEEQVSSCLKKYTYEEYGGITMDRLEEGLGARRKESSESFTQGKNYFISEIHASGDRYAFFSVPYDECWRATVNGESREVININGLMAVRIDAGDNTIRFDYVYTPLKQGIACSIAGVLLFAGYMIYFNKKKKRAVRQAAQSYEE